MGGADRRKMDEYLTAVREIEGRIQAAERDGISEVKPDFEKPEGVPFDYAEYVKIMLDLAATAFPCGRDARHHHRARPRRQPADV